MMSGQIAMFTRRTHELYRRLMEGTLPIEATFAGLQRLIEGNLMGKVVDLDADPFDVPEGWSVEEHKKGGVVDFDPAKITLYFSEKQKGNARIEGNKLREELKVQPVLNANLLDWLLKPENQHLIPKEWKGNAVFFWGTIYRRQDGGLYVRYLYWNDERRWNDYGWGGRTRWVGDYWDSVCLAVVSAS